MPEFNTTLLALQGISGRTYLGFKIPERQSLNANGLPEFREGRATDGTVDKLWAHELLGFWLKSACLKAHLVGDGVVSFRGERHLVVKGCGRLRRGSAATSPRVFTGAG